MGSGVVRLIAFFVTLCVALYLQHLYYETLYDDFCEWFEEYQKTDEWKYKHEEKKAEE